MEVLQSGTIDQPILAKKGDGICIDWGYVYLPAVNGKVSLGTSEEIKKGFIEDMKKYFPNLILTEDISTFKEYENDDEQEYFLSSVVIKITLNN